MIIKDYINLLKQFPGNYEIICKKEDSTQIINLIEADIVVDDKGKYILINI